MDCKYIHKTLESGVSVFQCGHPDTQNDFETHYCPKVNGRDDCPYENSSASVSK